jgi:hypothetical protein
LDVLALAAQIIGDAGQANGDKAAQRAGLAVAESDRKPATSVGTLKQARVLE